MQNLPQDCLQSRTDPRIQLELKYTDEIRTQDSIYTDLPSKDLRHKCVLVEQR